VAGDVLVVVEDDVVGREALAVTAMAVVVLEAVVMNFGELVMVVSTVVEAFWVVSVVFVVTAVEVVVTAVVVECVVVVDVVIGCARDAIVAAMVALQEIKYYIVI
jgi:hypothetical protein